MEQSSRLMKLLIRTGLLNCSRSLLHERVVHISTGVRVPALCGFSKIDQRSERDRRIRIETEAVFWRFVRVHGAPKGQNQNFVLGPDWICALVQAPGRGE